MRHRFPQLRRRLAAQLTSSIPTPTRTKSIKELRKHLNILKRQGVIREWYDREITAGTDWKGQIDQHLNSAGVILLLVSADFLASDYCYDVEMTRALERHHQGEARVIPIILRPTDWYGSPFEKLQPLPADGKPVTAWTNRDESFSNIAQGICRAIEQLKTSPLSIVESESSLDASPLPTASAKTGGPVDLFYSYAHEDEELVKELRKHLSILKRQGVIREWYDREITAGTDWKGQIDQHLNSAGVILLLVSADFLASDYCYDVEMTRALERHHQGEARVIPIILRPTDWYGSPFEKLQPLPADGKPVTAWTNRDESFSNIAQGICRAIEQLKTSPLSIVESESSLDASPLPTASAKTGGPVDLFYSYAHEDEELVKELRKHLSILKRQGVIREWYDREITAGTDWKGQIDQHLNSAGVILLLVSADFLASDYCYDVEMTLALERHDQGEARVIPVILRPVDWKGAPFDKLQFLPTEGKPVTSWTNRDQWFSNIAQGIRRAIEQLKTSPLSSGKVIRIDPVDLSSGSQEGQRVRTILLLGSSSSEGNQRRLNEVAKHIGQRLRRTKNRAKFSLVATTIASLEDLREALLDHRPEILQFVGHWEIDEPNDLKPLLRKNDHSLLDLASHPLTTLLRLTSDSLRCVLVITNVVDIQLPILPDIECIIGLDVSTSDEASLRFFDAFYDALLAGREYEDAFQFGTSAINLPSGHMAPIIRVNRQTRYRYPLEEVFKTSGVPSVTFVSPKEYKKLLVLLRTPGRGVVIEGPSGIGKTTAVIKGLEELRLYNRTTRLRSRKPDEREAIARLPWVKGSGIVMIDDFHVLEDATKKAMIDYVKVLADEEQSDTKLILVGINNVGESLIHTSHDLAGRIDVIKFGVNSDEQVLELIEKGEAALRVKIRPKREIVQSSFGSFSIAQMLCHEFCIFQDITESQEVETLLDGSLELVKTRVMDALSLKFKSLSVTFASGGMLRQEGRAPFLHLLKWLGESEEWLLSLWREMKAHFEQEAGIKAIIDNRKCESLLASDPSFSTILHYDSSTKVLAAEDPKYIFYLKNLNWNSFAAKVGFLDIDFVCRYDVAMSFAGPDRAVAQRLWEILTERQLAVFYDQNEQFRIIAQNVEDYLTPIYNSDSCFVVVLLSKSYPARIWTKFESKQFKKRFKKGGVIPIWFRDYPPSPLDESNNIGGLAFDPSVDMESQVQAIADVLAQRILTFRLQNHSGQEVQGNQIIR